MQKVVGLIVCVLVSVCGLVPYVFGVRTEQTLTTLVQVAEYVLDMPIYTTRYTRGWFGSTAETWLALPPAVAEIVRAYVPFMLTPSARVEGLRLVHHIRHGPFPLSARPVSIGSLLPVQTIITSSFIPGAPALSRDMRPATALPVFQVDTTVFLLGAGQSHVSIPAFTSPPEAQTEADLVWEGLQGDVAIDAQGRHITGVLQADGFTLTGEDTKFALHEVVARTNILTEPRYASQGDTAVRVGSVALTPRAEAQATWVVTGGEIQATTATTSGTLQAMADLHIETLRLGEASYGPGSSHLELRRLSLPALARLLQAISAPRQDEPDFASLWLRLLLSGDLARLLSGLARSSPEILLPQMSLHTTDGEVRARVQVRVNGNRLRAPGDLAQLIQMIDAEAEGEAPVSWVRALAIAQVRQAIRARSKFAAFIPTTALNALAATISDQQLYSLVQQEYLILDGNTYKSKARYTYGQLLVNGKPLDWPALVQE
jgi:uncharacterized protein YdgA (DUF945 family)